MYYFPTFYYYYYFSYTDVYYLVEVEVIEGMILDRIESRKQYIWPTFTKVEDLEPTQFFLRLRLCCCTNVI